MSSIEDKRRLSANELESPATEVAVEMPARNLYVKCPACRRVIEQQAMADNLDVCPRCGRHEGEGVSVEKLRQLGVYKNYNSTTIGYHGDPAEERDRRPNPVCCSTNDV